MPFNPPDINTDTDTAVDEILDAIADALPGWSPVEGSVETALAEEFAAESVAVASAALASIETAYAGIGETVFGVAVRPAVPATIGVTITVTAAGVVVPAGFTVTGTSSVGEPVAFYLLADTTSTGTTVAVTMTATQVGSFGNSVPVGALTIATATAGVTSAAATSASTGGADEEELTVYLARLVDTLSVLHFGGVIGRDLAVLARTVVGVDRALGLDGYDPANPGTPAEKTVTVFPIDAANQPVSAPIAAQVASTLAATREVNFVINVGTPTYTAVTILYAATVEPGVSPATVQTSINAALTAYIAGWGKTSTDPKAWVATNTVRYLDVARVAGGVSGVAHLTSLTVNGGTVDVTLPGAAALPTPVGYGATPSTVTGTVS